MSNSCKPLNVHGDRAIFLASGHGADIASQRTDDLDAMALRHAGWLCNPYAIDIACGAGGQAVRLAMAGAAVLAVDIADLEQAVMGAAALKGVCVTFMRADLRALNVLESDQLADLIVCQRAIHYLPYADAVDSLTAMRRLLSSAGRLYLSASGIESELGLGYAGADAPVATRYAELSADMRTKHDIHGPVCLYSESDMQALLIDSGFAVETLFSSEFGNIKAVAGVSG